MQVTIEIPDALATRLQAKWRDTLPHDVFERIVMTGYRGTLLTTRAVQERLGWDSGLAIYDLCDTYQISDYTLGNLVHDRATGLGLYGGTLTVGRVAGRSQA